MTVCGRYRLLTRGAAPWWLSLNVKPQVVILAAVGSSPIGHPKIFRRIYRRHHLYVMHAHFPPYPYALCTGRERGVTVRTRAGANGNPARERGGGVARGRGGVAGGSTCPLAARTHVAPARGMGTARARSRAPREQAGAGSGYHARPGRSATASLSAHLFFF